MSRARQVANFDPALFAADEVSGDKVHGGTISGSPTLVTPALGTPASGVLTNATFPAGHVIQYDADFETTGLSETGATFPSDGTKPQITEGQGPILSLAFSPKVAGSTLEILVNVGMDANEGDNLAIALFNTAIHATDAVAVSASRTGGTVNQNLTILYNYTTPSTASATWLVRAGGSASGSTTYVGRAVGFTYGASMGYGITIKEIMA